MPTEYPADFKQKVIKRYQNGESIKSLSHELHIAQGTLYRWRKAYCTIQGNNPRTYTPKEFDAISRRLAKLEHEMEIIRLSQCIANVPLQKRLSILENLHHQSDNTYSVHELCEALDVARGTFYNHIFQALQPARPRADTTHASGTGFRRQRPTVMVPKDSHYIGRRWYQSQHQAHCYDHAGARSAQHSTLIPKAV